MLFGIDMDEKYIKNICENIWRSQILFVYLQGK